MVSNCDENCQGLKYVGRGIFPDVAFPQRAQGFPEDFSATLELHVEILQLRHS